MEHGLVKEEDKSLTINKETVDNLQNLQYLSTDLGIIVGVIILAGLYLLFTRCRKGAQNYIWRRIMFRDVPTARTRPSVRCHHHVT